MCHTFARLPCLPMCRIRDQKYYLFESWRDVDQSSSDEEDFGGFSIRSEVDLVAYDNQSR